MDEMKMQQITDSELADIAGGDGRYYLHKVVKHDTLGKLAKHYGTTIQAIMDLNPIIKDPDRIQVGWTLKIPKK